MSFANYNLLKQIKENYGDYHLKPEEHRLVLEAINELAGVEEDPLNTINGLYAYQDRLGHIMETFSLVCDGQSVTVPSGTYTSQEVTGRQNFGYTYTDCNGSVLSYIPPANARIVLYRFMFLFRYVNAYPIVHQKLFIDDDEVLYARQTHRRYYPQDYLTFEWPFHIVNNEEDEDLTIGQVYNWDSLKTIKLMMRSYNGDHDGAAHTTVNWDGAGASYLGKPVLSITAIR